MHIPLHLFGGGGLPHDAIDARLNLLFMKVPVGNDARANRCQSVTAFNSQHRTGIGIAEVMESVVVADAVASDVVTGLAGRNISAGASDHDDDLALVIKPLTTERPHYRRVVGVQRTDGLMEVGGSRWQFSHELITA